MLFYLAAYSEILGPLRLFQYITFRTAFASVTALFLSILIGPYFIRALRELKMSHMKEKDELPFHMHKQGTPTMGGLLVIGIVCFTTLLFGNFSNRYIPMLVLVTVGLAAIGFIDDYLKLTQSPRGLSGRFKLVGQLFIGLMVGIALYLNPVEAGRLWIEGEAVTRNFGTHLAVPFLKMLMIPTAYFYIAIVAVIIVGSSNAVNLTDGLDGLAAGSVLACSIALAGLTYLIGNINFSEYLNVMYVRDVGEITVFMGALIGALLGFLWFNSYPAEVFMGDTGSLALGGVVGTVAILIKQELLLVIIGGIFVLEALSVIIQVISFQTTGRRVFAMAPLHHHFEKIGWPEPKVIVRFWIVAFVLALTAVATLKLR